MKISCVRDKMETVSTSEWGSSPTCQDFTAALRNQQILTLTQPALLIQIGKQTPRQLVGQKSQVTCPFTPQIPLRL